MGGGDESLSRRPGKWLSLTRCWSRRRPWEQATSARKCPGSWDGALPAKIGTAIRDRWDDRGPGQSASGHFLTTAIETTVP